jgi:uncharacterized protein YcgI (DUF1989 family)
MEAITVTVPAGRGRAVEVRAGRRLRLETPQGGQVADFFGFKADDMGEWLSPPHTMAHTRCVHPRQGDTFLSNRRRPLLSFLTDASGGIHDMLIPACDQVRYEHFGVAGPHRNCAENLWEALCELGHESAVVPQPVNFFMRIEVLEGGRLQSQSEAAAPPGAYVVLGALEDLICVISACPFDVVTPGWSINAAGGPTDLTVAVLD